MTWSAEEEDLPDSEELPDSDEDPQGLNLVPSLFDTVCQFV
jgi:hypothetical protein